MYGGLKSTGKPLIKIGKCKWGNTCKDRGGPERRVREGNGIPLQYSCLENPMDGGAW